MSITSDRPPELDGPSGPPLSPPPYDPPVDGPADSPPDGPADAASADAAGEVAGGEVDQSRGAVVRRVWRGHTEDPSWARPALLVLLLATLGLYTWGLSASGWANSFYSAAVQAGSTSWKAFFFGSSDAANSITVDKPPMSLWPMALSVRIFGLNTWSLLVPQALMGVATVGVLYATVRRWFSAGAGLIAGAVLALTPVAALMFRFNNPDALLVLLMVLGAYAALRAIEGGRARWVVLTGVAIGFGFLTKQLQVLLVVPGFALALLVAGQGSFWKRLRDLALAGVAMVVSAGWWIAIVELWPASSRPFIGGSQHNSILELTLGYNGFGRLTGNEVGSVGGGPAGGTSMWGATGITRLFTGEFGGQIAWLVPAALVFLAAGAWLTLRRPRTDMQRASLIVWGAWVLVTGLVFSFMAGIFHAYYTVALAPGIGALVGIGAAMLWARRTHLAAQVTLAVAVVVTAWWATVLLGRSAGWNTWLSPLIVVAAVLAAGGFLLAGLAGRVFGPTGRARVLGAAAVFGVVVGLTGPTAYAIETASKGHSGSIVTAGPAVANGTGFGRGGPGAGGMPGGFPGGAPTGGNFTPPAGFTPPTGGNFTPPAGATPPAGGNVTPPAGATPPTGGTAPGGTGGFPMAGGMAGMGGLLGASEVDDAVVAALQDHAENFTWAAATVGSNNASGYQLASEEPIMAIGGFNGSDPSPTLEQFQAYVAAGEIHYFIPSGLGGGNSMGGSSVGGEIASWVEANFDTVTIGGQTMYDLSS